MKYRVLKNGAGKYKVQYKSFLRWKDMLDIYNHDKPYIFNSFAEAQNLIKTKKRDEENKKWEVQAIDTSDQGDY